MLTKMISAPETILRRSFLFLRHGQADWNETGLCIGQADRPLTRHGLVQAHRAVSCIPPNCVRVVFHSPLSRAADTAHILAAALGCASVCESGLIEACLGEKEGCFEADPQDNFIDRWLEGRPIRGAEPYEALKKRVVEAVNRCLTAAPEGEPLLVSHWAVHFALTEITAVDARDIGHCVPRRFRPSEAGWRIEALS